MNIIAIYVHFHIHCQNFQRKHDLAVSTKSILTTDYNTKTKDVNNQYLNSKLAPIAHIIVVYCHYTKRRTVIIDLSQLFC